jgi:hypothetical protein
MDVHKTTISISVAEDGRSGPVRFLGVIPNQPDDIAKMAKRLAKHGELDFCYEASSCGYNIHRQLTGLGHKCTVAAPSMIPRKPGERIKTDRRDSEKLAILHRAGDLTPVWVPDTTHEALRDLVRARVDASMHLMRARQQLLAFLLRHGRSYSGSPSLCSALNSPGLPRMTDVTSSGIRIVVSNSGRKCRTVISLGLIVIVATRAPTCVSVALRCSGIKNAMGMNQQGFMVLTSSAALWPHIGES